MVVLLAVLEKRAGLHLSSHDVYVSVAGGVTVDEPAVDLGVAAAVASSLRDRPVDAAGGAIGEVGLAGGGRVVPQLEQRAAGAGGMGVHQGGGPKQGAEKEVSGVEVVPVGHIR